MGSRLKRLGVLGTMIWDTIVGRDPVQPPVEEWGGIAYALAGIDAALGSDWEIVPLVKVGRDLAERAQAFLRTVEHARRDARFVEVPDVNPRVRLSYTDRERRCEGLTGGVPPWTWPELGPMVVGLDALYVNFISGFECDVSAVQALRRAFPGPLYGDLHSLALGIRPNGVRHLRPVADPLAWLACFDIVQLNEDEMGQMGDEPLALVARALEAGVRAICVTLGSRGAVYAAAGDFTRLVRDAAPRAEGAAPSRGLVRTALVPTEGEPAAGDPTGCGDVFGATLFALLLAGRELEEAIREANRMAKRNVGYRGATGLQRHLRGELASSRSR